MHFRYRDLATIDAKHKVIPKVMNLDSTKYKSHRAIKLIVNIFDCYNTGILDKLFNKNTCMLYTRLRDHTVI